MANLMNTEGKILLNLCKFIESVMLAFYNVLCYVDYFVMFYSNVYNNVFKIVDNIICFTGHLPGISCILTCFFWNPQ